MFILICISASSCLSFSRPAMYMTDARLQAEISSFFQDCLGYFHRVQCMPEVNVQVEVRSLPSPQLGVCTTYPNNSLKIQIEPSLLKEDRKLLKLVVYHELMHCVFDIDHYDEDIDIMNKDSTYDQQILQNFNYYLQRAFTRIRLDMFRRMLKK